MEKFFAQKRQLELEGMNHFAKTILIPVSVLLLLLLMIGGWWHLKQNLRIKMYERVIRASIPKGHFEIDDED